MWRTGVHKSKSGPVMWVSAPNPARIWLQAQTLLDAASQIFKIHPFSKIAASLEPVLQLGCLQDLESPKVYQHSIFYEFKHYLQLLGRRGKGLLNESII